MNAFYVKQLIVGA